MVQVKALQNASRPFLASAVVGPMLVISGLYFPGKAYQKALIALTGAGVIALNYRALRGEVDKLFEG